MEGYGAIDGDAASIRNPLEPCLIMIIIQAFQTRDYVRTSARFGRTMLRHCPAPKLAALALFLTPVEPFFFPAPPGAGSNGFLRLTSW